MSPPWLLPSQPPKLYPNRLTTSPLPLPRSARRSVSPEVHAVSSEWISLTVGGGSPPAAPTPPLPPLPTVSYRWGEYLPPPFSASPVPLTTGSPHCISPMISPSASPLPPPYPPRPNSATPFLTFTPPQGQDLLSCRSPHLSRSVSPSSGPVLEGWLRGEKELTEGECAEGDRGRAAKGSRQNSPAEVSSAWCWSPFGWASGQRVLLTLDVASSTNGSALSARAALWLQASRMLLCAPLTCHGFRVCVILQWVSGFCAVKGYNRKNCIVLFGTRGPHSRDLAPVMNLKMSAWIFTALVIKLEVRALSMQNKRFQPLL